MAGEQALPVPQAERAPALDALRGVALFGVLLVNLETAFRVSLFEQFMPAAPRASSDQWVALAMTIGLEFKAFSLFAFLFGVGLEAQRERAVARDVAFRAYALRRLGMLLAIGLVHMFLVWNGDILALYAVTGLLALPLLRLAPRALVPIAIALFAVQLFPVPWPNPFSSFDEMRDHVARAREVYALGSFRETLAFRVHEIRHVAPLLLWILPRTLGLHLLGVSAWRGGIFRGERRRLVVAMAVLGLGLGFTAVSLVQSGRHFGRWPDELLSGWSPIAIALGYASLVVLAFDRAPLARVLSLVAPLGRMALTSYLTQSVVLGLLFYGYGLGLFGRLGETRAAQIGVALYVTQAIASALWLRAYRFGPVEWLWRSFTYGARQPMRR